MKITKKHHKNSQLHSIPDKDTELKHEVSLDCPCQPKISINNGHLIVEHRKVGGGGNLWRLEASNFGVKYKL